MTVTITVSNTVPVAADDMYNLPTNGLRRVAVPGVLVNDGDYAGDGLSAVKMTDPAHGILMFESDGSFMYIPNADYVGVDSFTYKATDGSVDTNVATVTLQVSPFGPPLDNAPGVVYRFYNLKTNAHFYTNSLEERNGVLRKYQGILSYEGPAFWSFPAAGTIPIHRFYNVVTQSHFYTASDQEKAKVMALWPYLYTYEGKAFHVYPTYAAGRCPVYRFYNASTGLHFYTISEAERAYVNKTWPNVWYEEGAAFYVLNGEL